MPETKLVPQGPTDVAGLSYPLPQDLEQTQEVATAIARGLRRASRQARTPSVIVKGGAGFRARKGDRAFRLGVISSFIAFVIAPFLVASIYWGLIASDQYSTQMKFTIHAGEKSPLDSLGGMIGGGMLGGGAGSQDTQIVADFIRSRAMVDALQDSLNLKRIYSYPEADYFSRFNPSKPVEDLEKYWRKRVDVKVESLSGIVAVDVRAFTPEDSRALGTKILELSEKLVNDISMRARRDAVTQAKIELARAEDELQATTATMRDTRNSEGVLDAGAAAEAIDRIVGALKLELSKLEQDLASQGDAGENSPQSRVLQSRAGALKAQIADYNKQIASLGKASGGPSMADRMSTLSRKQIDLDLARQRYAMAAAIYENARVDLETQHSYLAVSLRPSLAEKAMYPRRWWEWSIIVLPAIVGWALLVAIAFLVRDHMAK
jgi:capsular polysaccharide transport system permease protein